jgi:hypothetical protein
MNVATLSGRSAEWVGLAERLRRHRDAGDPGSARRPTFPLRIVVRIRVRKLKLPMRGSLGNGA